jgi:hypothetical protein
MQYTTHSSQITFTMTSYMTQEAPIIFKSFKSLDLVIKISPKNINRYKFKVIKTKILLFSNKFLIIVPKNKVQYIYCKINFQGILIS